MMPRAARSSQSTRQPPACRSPVRTQHLGWCSTLAATYRVGKHIDVISRIGSVLRSVGRPGLVARHVRWQDGQRGSSTDSPDGDPVPARGEHDRAGGGHRHHAHDVAAVRRIGQVDRPRASQRAHRQELASGLPGPDPGSPARHGELLDVRWTGQAGTADHQRDGRRRRAIGVPPTVRREGPYPEDRVGGEVASPPRPSDWYSTMDVSASFSCRPVTGQTTGFSNCLRLGDQRPNPTQNPYVTGGGEVLRKACLPYLDRTQHLQGMIPSARCRGAGVHGHRMGLGRRLGTRSRTTCTSR